MTKYFAYSVHPTFEAADQRLAAYLETGIICESERPWVKKERRVTRDQSALYRTVYCVMFPG